MKIAHINNISGIGSDLSQAQILQGHLSDVYVFNPKIYNQFGGTMINYRSPFSRWKVFRKLKEYDIWHYHYPYGSLKAGRINTSVHEARFFFLFNVGKGRSGSLKISLFKTLKHHKTDF
jgi:hypothetical protein